VSVKVHIPCPVGDQALFKALIPARPGPRPRARAGERERAALDRAQGVGARLAAAAAALEAARDEARAARRERDAAAAAAAAAEAAARGAQERLQQAWPALKNPGKPPTSLVSIMRARGQHGPGRSMPRGLQAMWAPAAP